MEATEFIGEEAIARSRSLVVLGHDVSGWETHMKSPESEEYWVLTYPDSSLQGGGVPHLVRSTLEAWLHNQSLKPTPGGAA